MSEPSGIDNDYKLALGSLIFETSKLDSKLTEIIAAITGMNILHSIIVVHHQQFANKLDCLKALFRLVYPDEKDPRYAPIKEVLDRLKTLGDFRNSVVHTMWKIEDGVPHTVRFQARGELKRSTQPAPVEKIRQCTLEAIDLAGSLDMLSQAYREWLKSAPQSQT